MITDCDDPGLMLKKRQPYGLAFPILRVVAVALVGLALAVGIVGVGVYVWEAQVRARISVPQR